MVFGGETLFVLRPAGDRLRNAETALVVTRDAILFSSGEVSWLSLSCDAQHLASHNAVYSIGSDNHGAVIGLAILSRDLDTRFAGFNPLDLAPEHNTIFVLYFVRQHL